MRIIFIFFILGLSINVMSVMGISAQDTSFGEQLVQGERQIFYIYVPESMDLLEVVLQSNYRDTISLLIFNADHTELLGEVGSSEDLTWNLEVPSGEGYVLEVFGKNIVNGDYKIDINIDGPGCTDCSPLINYSESSMDLFLNTYSKEREDVLFSDFLENYANDDTVEQIGIITTGTAFGGFAIYVGSATSITGVGAVIAGLGLVIVGGMECILIYQDYENRQAVRRILNGKSKDYYGDIYKKNRDFGEYIFVPEVRIGG